MAVRKKGTPVKKNAVKKKPAAKKKPARKITGGKKSTSRQRLNTRRTAKKSLVFSELKKNLLGILVLVSICLTAAMIADMYFQPGRGSREQTVQKPPAPAAKELAKAEKKSPEPVKNKVAVKKPVPHPGQKKPSAKKPEKSTAKAHKPFHYEVFKDVEPVIVEKPRPRVKDKIPRIAIIIDDIGYDRKLALALFELSPDITFSILPYSPFGRQISKRLHARGAQLMLHLPMEPVEYPEINPGPGAILSSMTPDQLLAQLEKDIHEIPYIVGVNNHMGSRITASSVQMNQIFTILKKENLFFIDSRTAPKSQGKASARLLQLRFAQRDVFLDNFQDEAYITGQFKELIDLAHKHGSAIGIGHPYKATLETLSHLLPKIREKVRIVRASELTYLPG